MDKDMFSLYWFMIDSSIVSLYLAFTFTCPLQWLIHFCPSKNDVRKFSKKFLWKMVPRWGKNPTNIEVYEDQDWEVLPQVLEAKIFDSWQLTYTKLQSMG